MKSPLPMSNRLSNFRFSLASIRVGPLSPRSPVSPLTPKTPKMPQQQGSLSICHSSSPSSTQYSDNIPTNKEPYGLAVTVVESSDGTTTFNKSLPTPRALPTPTHSPITPWHATFHRNAASTDAETRYLNQTFYLRWFRVVLCILLLGVATTITGLQGDVLRHYNATHLPSSFSLPNLWPTNTNLTPTILLLTTGCVTTFLSLTTLIVTLIPTPTPKRTLTTTLFTTLITLTATLSLATILTTVFQSSNTIFSNFISSTLTSLVSTTGPKSTTGLTPNGFGSSPKAETIQSFTCALSNTATQFNDDAQTLNLPYLSNVNDMVPAHFGKMCVESRASLGLLVAGLALAGLGLGVMVWTWWVERAIERARGEREVLGSRGTSGTSSRDEKKAVVDMPAFVSVGDLERAS